MASKKTKRTSAKGNGFTTAALEKEFRAAPAKIAACYNKELVIVQQKEKKLVGELNKIQAKHKMHKTKQTALAAKSTPASKKQLAATKKMMDGLDKNAKHLSAQIAELKKQRQILADNKSKFSHLGKQLTALEKQWAAPKKAAPKKPKTIKKQKEKIEIITAAAQEPLIQSSEFSTSFNTEPEKTSSNM